MRIAVLGLGEAGSRLAADLEAAGAVVVGYDPDPVRGTGGAADVATAVAGSEIVLSVNAVAVAAGVAAAASQALGRDSVYADLNTAAPALKRELAELVGEARFADVALLGPVPTRGLRTSALASGGGARRFVAALEPFGMPVEPVSATAGDAATLKLLRSVFMKGLAAAAIESHAAAEAAGHADWLEEQVSGVIGRPLLERLLEGSTRHAARRVDELEAVRELLLELGVEPRITDASAALLGELARG